MAENLDLIPSAVLSFLHFTLPIICGWNQEGVGNLLAICWAMDYQQLVDRFTGELFFNFNETLTLGSKLSFNTVFNEVLGPTKNGSCQELLRIH